VGVWGCECSSDTKYKGDFDSMTCGRFRGRVCEVCVDFGFGDISCHAIIRSPVVSEKITPDWDCLQANNMSISSKIDNLICSL
jgi:hypothetical protein